MKFFVALRNIQDLVTGQVRGVAEMREGQSLMKDIFALNQSLDHLKYTRGDICSKRPEKNYIESVDSFVMEIIPG